MSNEPSAGDKNGEEGFNKEQAKFLETLMRDKLQKVCNFNRQADFTFYLPRPSLHKRMPDETIRSYFNSKVSRFKGEISEVGNPPMNEGGLPKPSPAWLNKACTESFDFEETITIDGKEKKLRVQASSSNQGRAWSLTVRWDPPPRQGSKPDNNPGKPVPEKSAESASALFKGECEWFPNPKYWPSMKESYSQPDKQTVDGNLFSIEEVVDVLYEALFPESKKMEPVQGLLLIAGATASAKSQIARGLAYRYLCPLLEIRRQQGPSGRNPHVLTHEDPIEKLLFAESKIGSAAKQVKQRHCRHNVDYTPRQLRFDTDSLEETINAALRQKPALLYVGEARDPDDLRRCLEFGGTGHFVVLTAHAGNLIEAVEKLLEAVGAQTPGQRALWVPKLFGVVHLARLSCRPPAPWRKGPWQLADHLHGLVPTVYRRTSQGRQSLVADGLSSLLPYCPQPHDRRLGSLGRQYFAQRLCEEPPASPDFSGQPDEVQELWRSLRDWNAGGKATDSRGDALDGLRLVEAAHREDLHG